MKLRFIAATLKLANQQALGKLFYSSTGLQNGLMKRYSTNVAIFPRNLRKHTKTL